MQRVLVAQQPINSVIELACQTLAAGGLLIFPTETTYGAGVDATNAEAVEKLLAYKSRREGKPLSIAVTDQSMAEQFVELTPQAKTLYTQFLPGPVTIVSTVKPNSVAPGVASEFGTLGVRIPDYPLMLQILAAYGKPITATSANGSGKARPYNIDAMVAQLSNKQRDLIDLIIDAGTLPTNPPSTVIDTTHSTPVTFRQGSVSISAVGANTELQSGDPSETQAIAGKLLLKHWNQIRQTGLLIGLDGSLGAGKTVFAQGAAQFLQIAENISSPTYGYMEEYPFERHQVKGVLHHLDLWKINDSIELERLSINRLLQQNNVVFIEWFAPHAEYLNQLSIEIGVPVVRVQIKDTTDTANSRTILISE